MRTIPQWRITALKAFAASMGVLIILGGLFETHTGMIIQISAFGPVLPLLPKQALEGSLNPAGILCLCGWCCLTALWLKGWWVYLLSIAWIATGFAVFISNLAQNFIT